MRVATNAYTNAMLDQFSTLTGRQNNLQNEVSTGLSVQAPSDDPAAMENTLNDLAASSAQQQYSANISTLQSRATSISSVLSSIQTITSSASEVATSAGSGTNSQSKLNDYADQINQLINQVVAAANTKDSATGNYLFAGTDSAAQPFAATTDASGNVTAVTYNGNSNVNQSEIGANLKITVDVPGVNTGSSGARGLITDSQSGADLINHLITLRDDLTAGDTASISGTDIANLQNDENNIAYQVANNGVRSQQLTTAATLATSNSTTLSSMISNASSADLATAMVQLTQSQTAYQAALESGSKIMNLSLLNYLS
jgi:flagellar hook-associated protein 3 FlgL